ncbi:hypothetical protein [Neptunomonas japonica]|uniref:hypothetical protein n=1 Tax=Neptunomonas japonica TaxID=417574 RepID=UPI00191573E2|nr:hypothetical protein [Neptunomonas japonica]
MSPTTCLHQPIEVVGKLLVTSASIGVAVFPEDDDCIEDLLYSLLTVQALAVLVSQY